MFPKFHHAKIEKEELENYLNETFIKIWKKEIFHVG
jgi:hypothetical protein